MSNFVVCLPTYLAVLENKANKVFNQKSLVKVGFSKTAIEASLVWLMVRANRQSRTCLTNVDNDLCNDVVFFGGVSVSQISASVVAVVVVAVGRGYTIRRNVTVLQTEFITKPHRANS